MARKKTKKQKIKSKANFSSAPIVNVSDTGLVSLSLDDNQAKKTKATTFSQSQVSLLYKDLLKTLITTAIVFGVLIYIYLNVR